MPARQSDGDGAGQAGGEIHLCDLQQLRFLEAGPGRRDIRAGQKPHPEAAIKDGTITSYGYLAHQTGGQWRRAEYVHGAGSVQALLDAQKKIGDQADANEKNKKLGAEVSAICPSHDDYIWRRVAGNIGTVHRGAAAFSTYYVCDQTRESQADAVVTGMLAPVFDKMVTDGKLKSWGWTGAHRRRQVPQRSRRSAPRTSSR